MKKFVSITLLFLWVGIVHAQPTITADGPLEFCYGESVTLCVEPAYSSYLWFTGSTTQCITVTESGDYHVLMLDSQGNIDSTFADSAISVIVHHPEPLVYASGDSLVLANAEEFVSFQWIWTPTGQPIQNETSSILVDSLFPCCPCCYRIEVTDSMGCTGSSYCMEFPVLLPDSCYEGTDESHKSLFSLLPNPTSNICSIRFDGQSTIEAISIWDSNGKLVFDKPMTKQLNSLSIETEHWPNGIYFVSVVDKKGRRHSEKLVVQHD